MGEKSLVLTIQNGLGAGERIANFLPTENILLGRLYQCNRCKKQASPTAGTIFHATKLPLTLWFAAIHLTVTAKNGISSVELGRRLGVKQPTAWAVKHKIMAVMARREGETALAGRVEMDDAYLGGVAGGFGLASIKGPSHAHHNGMQLIRIGEMRGGLSERVEAIAAVWRDVGFSVNAYEDINQLVWDKFICNVTFSAPCTVFGRTLGELMNDSHA